MLEELLSGSKVNAVVNPDKLTCELQQLMAAAKDESAKKILNC